MGIFRILIVISDNFLTYLKQRNSLFGFSMDYFLPRPLNMTSQRGPALIRLVGDCTCTSVHHRGRLEFCTVLSRVKPVPGKKNQQLGRKMFLQLGSISPAGFEDGGMCKFKSHSAENGRESDSASLTKE